MITAQAHTLRRHLDKLQKGFKRGITPIADHVVSLFNTCNWQPNSDRFSISSTVETDKNLLGRYRLAIASHSSMLITVPKTILHDQDNDDFLTECRNAAFNRGIRWSFVSDFETSFFIDNQWDKVKPFITFRDGQYSEKLDDAFYLTPDAFLTNAVEKRSKAEQPSDIKNISLVPIVLFDHFKRWRDRILQELNPKKESVPVIDEQIYLLLNRLTFIRFCEDKGFLHHKGYLKDILRSDSKSYRTLLNTKLNEVAEIFNSELFEKPDIPLEFNKYIPEVINFLYGYPEYNLQYDFSLMNSDILGALYEQFLKSKPIEIRIEKKSDLLFSETTIEQQGKQKEKGIYYTPSFIVNYIVKHTVERYLKDNKSAFPKILDFSSGSGIFLCRALQVLQNNHNPANSKELINILHSCIFGIDENIKAVDASRLNLWIQYINNKSFKGKLPRLSKNIVHGDALINLYGKPELLNKLIERGPRLISEEKDDFKNITSPESYDIIIGNPPFVSIENLLRDEELDIKALKREYYENYYNQVAHGKFDLSALFLYRAIELLKPDGVLGIIVTNRFMTNKQSEPMRNFLLNNIEITKFIDFTDQQVFKTTDGSGPTTYTCIIIGRKRKPRKLNIEVGKIFLLTPVPELQLLDIDLRSTADCKGIAIHNTVLPTEGEWHLLSKTDTDLINSLRSRAVQLDLLSDPFEGINTGAEDVFCVKKISSKHGQWIVRSPLLGKEIEIEKDVLKPFIGGREIKRYIVDFNDDFLIYPYDEKGIWDADRIKSAYPSLWNYLSNPITKRRLNLRKEQPKVIYGLPKPRDYMKLITPKLLLGKTQSESLNVAYDKNGKFFFNTHVMAIVTSDSLNMEALCSLLNSRLYFWYLSKIGQLKGGGSISAEKKYLETLPVPNNFLAPSRPEVIKLRENYLELSTLYAEIDSVKRKNIFDRGRFYGDIYRLEEENNMLAYSLFNMSQKEIALIEDFFKKRDEIRALKAQLG